MIVAKCCQAEKGVPPGRTIALYQIRGADVFITFSDEGWANVVSPTWDATTVLSYEQFGYNWQQRRWSYGISPKYSTILKQLIHEEISNIKQKSNRSSAHALTTGTRSQTFQPSSGLFSNIVRFLARLFNS